MNSKHTIQIPLLLRVKYLMIFPCYGIVLYNRINGNERINYRAISMSFRAKRGMTF